MNPLQKTLAAALSAGLLISATAPPALALPQGKRPPAPTATTQSERIRRLVNQALDKLRGEHADTKGALRLLRQALKLGGGQDPQWHAAFALLGLRLRAPATRIEKSCLRALRGDPQNRVARFVLLQLTRQRLMRRLRSGRVAHPMGLTKANPIKLIGLFAEEAAYLTLFRVKLDTCGRPMTNPTGTLAAYVCRNRQAKMVTYYFDRSAIKRRRR
ncbi:MAG: hypothetical protein KJ621_10455 [Proteobacteria bacterium]|nr:hypothetical protein [Pseudomonadota bacterium]MBU1741008.1 hypothetical protein [Pseudomonadota bacterium]